MCMSTPPTTPQAIFEQTTIAQVKKIVSDRSHVLYPEYRLMPSGRRYEVHACEYNMYKHSFVPLSIPLLNRVLAEGRQGRGKR